MIFKESLVFFIEQLENDTDIITLIEMIVSILSLLLGVITIVLGKEIIESKRENAKYGFYINFLVFIERFQEILKDYPGITAHLIKEEVRMQNDMISVSNDLAEKTIPIFCELCDDFIKFISRSDNNVVPKHLKSSSLSEEDEWNNWYNNTKQIVLYVQKCKLMSQKICPYFSGEQIELYIKENDAFSQSLKYMEEQIKNAIAFKKKNFIFNIFK